MPSAVSSVSAPSFLVRAASADEELDYLRYLAGKSVFYHAHGYAPSLPDHPLFAPLGPSETGSGDIDWPALDAAFRASLYRPEDYAAGIAALEAQRDRLASVSAILGRWQEDWSFDLRDRYTVVLTLYGVGGSYDVRSGRILIRTTSAGAFKRKHPFHTVLHEAVHIGVEELLVRPFRLAHAEKERLVDLLCLEALRDDGDYEAADRGDRRMDPYVTGESLRSLPVAIRGYAERYPREERDR